MTWYWYERTANLFLDQFLTKEMTTSDLPILTGIIEVKAEWRRPKYCIIVNIDDCCTDYCVCIVLLIVFIGSYCVYSMTWLWPSGILYWSIGVFRNDVKWPSIQRIIVAQYDLGRGQTSHYQWLLGY